MDIALTSEQQLLRDTITRLLKDNCEFSARQHAKSSDEGWSRSLWSIVAREGFLGLLCPVEEGGFGGGPRDTLIVMQALGEVLALEPYLATAIVVAPAIAAWGDAEQRERYVPGLIAGELVGAFAYAEGDGRELGPQLAVRAVRDGVQWRLRGHKAMAPGAATADVALVAAQADGGVGLFLVELDDDGVARTPYRLHDGTRTADLSFDGARAQLIGELGGGEVDLCVARAVAGLLAEAVGVLNTAYNLTLEHLRTRHQFGKPIGSNQALQHRAAEMLVSLELCRSMALFAASAVELKDKALRAARLSQAKVVISRQGWKVADAAVQLHGGMGMVEEYPVGVCLKRLLVIDGAFGDSGHHLKALARAYEISTL